MCLFAAFETLFDPSVHYTYARREEAWLRSACHTDFRRGIYVSKALNDADESAWVASFGSRLESLPQLLELLARVQYHRRFEGALGQALRRAERVLPAARHCAPERSGATKAGVGAAALREIVGAAATSQSPVSAARKAGQLSAAATRADTAESVAEALRAIADAAFHTAAQSAVHAAVSLMASHADAKRAVVAAKADADVGAVKGASWFASRSAKKAPQHATDPSKKEHVGVGSGSEAACVARVGGSKPANPAKLRRQDVGAEARRTSRVSWP
ncbi:hypothetical protein M885DRAFT_249184 [Pelagophyceae sp. CCMP2097]|nr:hypothetical protein M885DRAFT_249184 [Pelagophyceae sp. CCMP2097]